MGISIAEAIAEEARYFGFEIEHLSNEYMIGTRNEVKFSLMKVDKSLWRLGIRRVDLVLLDESGLTYAEVLKRLENHCV